MDSDLRLPAAMLLMPL